VSVPATIEQPVSEAAPECDAANDASPSAAEPSTEDSPPPETTAEAPHTDALEREQEPRQLPPAEDEMCAEAKPELPVAAEEEPTPAAAPVAAPAAAGAFMRDSVSIDAQSGRVMSAPTARPGRVPPGGHSTLSLW